MSKWNIVIVILGLLPYGFLLSLLTFYFHVAAVIGRLPFYDNPDPKKLAIYSSYKSIIDSTGSIWMYSFFAWILVVLPYLIIQKRSVFWKPSRIGTIGYLVGILLFFSGIMKWYAD